MRKRVLIDATTIVEKKDGLSQYIISFLANMPDDAFNEFHLMILVNKNLKRKEFWEILSKQKIEVIKTKIAPIGPKRDWDMFFFLQKFKGKFDLFHSTSNQYPLFLKNGIATVHDITFKKYLDSRWWTFNMARNYLNLVIKKSIKNASAIIAVSNYTKQDLINTYCIESKLQDKIKVIYEGWEHLQNNSNEKFDVNENISFINYLFYVGTTRKHKNISNLLRAFELALDSLPKKINLVISGNEGYLNEEDTARVKKINTHNTRVFFTGFISGHTLDKLYKNCDGFIFPSLSEGFGIPVLESFFYKKPLLCSNTTSLPEIAGNAALYFNPEDVNSISKQIIFFYENIELHNQLIEKGNIRLNEFSWKHTSQQIIELYKSALNKAN